MILGGEAEWVVAGASASGGGGAKRGIIVVGDGGVGRANGDDIGHILVAIVHQEGRGFTILPEGERARGDGLGGVPDELLVDIPRLVGEELLDAEVAVVEEDGVGELRGAIHLTVGDAATEAVKGHRDDLRPLRPTDWPVLGVVLHLPNAGCGLDGGLIAVAVVLGHEVVDGGVLVEVVGSVALALGGGAIADVVVSVRDFVSRDELIADVVAVLLGVLGGAATKEVVGVGVGTDDRAIGLGIDHLGEQVARGLITPRSRQPIGIGKRGLQVRARQVAPGKGLALIERGDTPGRAIITQGGSPRAIDAITRGAAVAIVVMGQRLGIEPRDGLAHQFADLVVGKDGGAT